MAKKFGKFLMFTAFAGAAMAGAYYYLQNKNSSYSDDMDDDDDYDDFHDDSDIDAENDESIGKPINRSRFGKSGKCRCICC